MRKFVVIAAAFALPTAAHAEAFNGPYVGVELGHDNYELKAKGVDASGLVGTEAAVEGNLDGLSGNGAVGGLYAGYDYSFGNVFVGLEGNVNISGAKISASLTDGVDTLGLRVKAKESYGIAGRFGVKAAENVGIYAKLGWTNTKFKATLAAFDEVLSDKETEDSIVYGAGLEAGVAQNMSLRVEYSVADYGKIGLGSGVTLNNSNVRAGLSYRF